MSTGNVWSATRPMALYTSRLAGQAPTLASPGRSSSGGVPTTTAGDVILPRGARDGVGGPQLLEFEKIR
jgi:hypothetical protein